MVDTKNDGGMFYDMKVAAQFMQYGGLTEKKGYKGNDTNAKYGAEFILAPDHPDLAPMKEIAKQVARAEWGDNVDVNTIEWPFKSGNKLSEKRVAKGKAGDLYAGKVIMRPRSLFAVELVWSENGAFVKTASDTEFAKLHVNTRFYPGVLASGSFKFQAMEIDGAEGTRKLVVCYLNKVFSTGKGERVGGRSAEEAFKGYLGRASAEDPTKGRVADDDIPF